jgi:hypothetical protein
LVAAGLLLGLTGCTITTGNGPLNNRGNTAPTDPSLNAPDSAAVIESTTTALSWTSYDYDGDNLTYDVYLDTNPSPGTKVASAITTQTYQAMGLIFDKTYYWKVTFRLANTPPEL